VTAEIVVVVEDENSRGRPGGAAIEPSGRKPADAAPHDDEVVALLGRQPVDGKALAIARLRVRGFERAFVLAAQPGQRGRIAPRLGGDLRRRRQSCGDGQRRAVEKVATGDVGHLRPPNVPVGRD
jgi:hypothetical protein